MKFIDKFFSAGFLAFLVGYCPTVVIVLILVPAGTADVYFMDLIFGAMMGTITWFIYYTKIRKR